MTNLFELYGINPEEWSARLFEGYVDLGLGAADAMRAAAVAADVQAGWDVDQYEGLTPDDGHRLEAI